MPTALHRLTSVTNPERLERVRASGLLDSAPEEAFDRLTQLAARVTRAPVTFISVVDENRDFYKACFGFPEPLASDRELTGTTFCHYAIESTAPLAIADTLADPMYRDVPTVKSLGIRAYLGIPLVDAHGSVLGSFCAVDFKPRPWSQLDIDVMQELAASTMREVDLRNAIQALERERSTLRTVLENIPAAVMFAEAPSGRVVMGNSQVEQILGHTVLLTEDAVQQWTGRHADGRNVEPWEWPLERALRGDVVSGFEVLYQRPDGRELWIRIHGAPVRAPDGEIIGSIVAFYDVDEQRRMALENERLYDEARRANQAKDEFFAAVTHELRTPMTAIIGWSRLLKMENLDNPEAAEAADMIESSARLQARLVDDLLDVSRIGSGKIVLNREPLDIRDVVDEALRAAEPAANVKGVSLRQNVGAVPHINADRSRLRQIFGNLLSNAIKFTPAGGLVGVGGSATERDVVLTVRDTGRGIAPELLPRIFERGQQARDAEQGGLGLGLTIVQHLVAAHGGTIRAESEGAGKGSLFTVTLPIG